MNDAPRGPIIVCYDGSPGSLTALQQAASSLGDGPRLVVTVWQTISTQRRASAGFGASVLGDTSAGDDDELVSPA